jgi:hypothetical protein
MACQKEAPAVGWRLGLRRNVDGCYIQRCDNALAIKEMRTGQIEAEIVRKFALSAEDECVQSLSAAIRD